MKNWIITNTKLNKTKPTDKLSETNEKDLILYIYDHNYSDMHELIIDLSSNYWKNICVKKRTAVQIAELNERSQLKDMEEKERLIL